MTPPPAIHATVVARASQAGWRAVLLTGDPGVGKSDLALRLVADGWRLVADDYAEVFASGGAVFARAPEPLSGLIEVRGQPIATMAPVPLARVVLVVACEAATPERLPEPETRTVAGVALPLLRLVATEASAPARIAVAFRRFRFPAD